MNTIKIDLLKRDYGSNNYIGVYPYIVQIGTGGTGGYVVQHLAQMLGTSGIPHSYIIADPDEIEEKNLRNQLFLEEEIGLKKADVLAERYSSAYNIEIGSFSDQYIESVEELKKLFYTEYEASFGYAKGLHFLPILIGSVDNSYSRNIMHNFFKSYSNSMIYIDAGNESTKVPSDWQTRPLNHWTDEELKNYKESGWSGQVVCGVKLHKRYYQPSLLDCKDLHFEHDNNAVKPSGISCSELTASEPQRVIVNKFAALAVVNYINQIIEDHSISTHITLFHAKKGYMRSYGYAPEDDME